jgi:3-dehydroquinate dehydratase-2
MTERSRTTHNRVEVLHGVNLEMLGARPSEHYGNLSFDNLIVAIRRYARELDLEVRFFHTNHEGEFVERLHRLRGLTDGAVLNPGAWTHYSWAIRDALEIADVPAVEVHLSDLEQREGWRQHSVLEGLVIGSISGKGPEGYRDALTMLKERIEA